MTIQARHDTSVPQGEETGIDQRRCASWLLSAYSEPVWVVADTRDIEKVKKINFDYRLADGRSLLEADRLCATVKEYAWWVRDSRYSRIDDAEVHRAAVHSLMHLAHALTLRGMWTFAHLQPYDLEQLIEECRFGADSVVHASARVEKYLQELASNNEIDPQPYGGLPLLLLPSGRLQKCIDTAKVVAACNLPSSAAKNFPRVSALLGHAAVANGLRRNRGGDNKASNDVPPFSNVTVLAMQRWLVPLEQLFAMRRRIEAEAICFRPFPQGSARVSAVKGVGTNRTSIAPPMLALHLLEASARWIHDHRSVMVGSPDRTSIIHMATACWISIAAFTARRDEEIDDLRDGCLRGSDASGWWLHVYIEKTLQRKEWIPIPLLVARAVEVLSVVSASARNATKDDRLFQWLPPNGAVARIDVGRHLDDFAAAVQVPLHQKKGEPAVAWHWHPHQFRRFFAVLYFYRFEGATLEALSHYLRHFSLEMTRRYVTQDPEVAALWTDVEWGYMGHVARSVVAGERSVSGAAGERLKNAAKRLIDMFRRKLQVVSPERVGASLKLIMQRQGMVLTPKPWVTCSCPNTQDAAKIAACRQERPSPAGAVGPDFAHAGPTVCSMCPHAISEGARKSFVDAEVSHLEAAAAHSTRAETIFGHLEKARVVQLTQARETRYASAEPLSATLLDVS